MEFWTFAAEDGWWNVDVLSLGGGWAHFSLSVSNANRGDIGLTHASIYLRPATHVDALFAVNCYFFEVMLAFGANWKQPTRSPRCPSCNDYEWGGRKWVRACKEEAFHHYDEERDLEAKEPK